MSIQIISFAVIATALTFQCSTSLEASTCIPTAADVDLAAEDQHMSLLQTHLSHKLSKASDATEEAYASTSRTLSTWQQALQADPKLFEGCSKVFLDVGSNRGTHIRKLFEPEKYPKAHYLQVFDHSFGHHRNRTFSETGICAFGFEANPRWTSTYEQIEQSYAAKGWHVKWFAPVAVGNQSGTVTFYLNDDGNKSDWGASEIATQESAVPIQVPEWDLSGFMEKLNAHALPGYRLMKMDIEGAEYDVLPSFLEKNILCKGSLDKLTIEWHPRNLPESQLPTAYDIGNRTSSKGKCGQRGDTHVQTLDDESYLNDGKPLP